jgi:hypothetical protein
MKPDTYYLVLLAITCIVVSNELIGDKNILVGFISLYMFFKFCDRLLDKLRE